MSCALTNLKPVKECRPFFGVTYRFISILVIKDELSLNQGYSFGLGLAKLPCMHFLLIVFSFLSLSILAPSFGYSATGPEFSKDFPEQFKVYLNSALEELYQVKGQGATPFHYKVFGGPVDGAIYRNWFHARVRKIKMQKDDCNFTAKIDSEGEPGVIYICSKVNQSPGLDSKLYWLSVLFHEARHLEPQNQYWKHQICMDEASGAVKACDPSAFGPYGLEKIFSYNLVHYCSNCGDNFKKQALEVFEDETNWSRLGRPAQDQLVNDFPNK